MIQDSDKINRRSGGAKPGRGRRVSFVDRDSVLNDPASTFGERLSALRKSCRLSQQDAAEAVSRECGRLLGREPITNRAVSKWERGDSLPDAQQFIVLMALYGVTDVQRVFRCTPSAPDPFAGLNMSGRERAEEYIGMLENDPRYAASSVQRPKKRIRLYDMPASAGTGVFLDGDSYTMIEADAPGGTDLAIRISGDSMSPMFESGQIVYVHRQQELENGAIGIFVLNGEGFCKKFDTSDGVRLVSLNPKYPPIELKASDDLRIAGRVLE